MENQRKDEYQPLAQIYDSIMAGVSYDAWLKLILDICAENSLDKSAKFLEIGGGTGILGKKLREQGFNYIGSDLSFSMASVAKNKNLDFLCTDCRNLPFKSKFNFALFLFDGINYLFSMDDYRKTFEQIHSVLCENGLFLFDITTQINSKNNFISYREASAGENYAYIRDSYFDEKKLIQHNDFEIFLSTNGKDYKRFSERHEQKIHSVETVKNAIPTQLFDIIGIWGDFNRRRYNSKSERVHFLLKRK